MSRIAIKGLTKSYGAGPVVDDLELEINEGEFLTLLGPSGCGKTTTLRAVAGLETPDAGQISIGDRVVTCMAEGRNVPPNKRALGMVFQSYAVWPHMSVFNNVAYPLRRKGVGGTDLEERVMTSLESVGLGHAATRSATKLSGGQQQRVALARAMVGDPEVLLFDEPLSNLDAQLRISMRDEILRMRDGGKTSIYVTHDQTEAFALSDRIAIMLDGRIVQLDTPVAVMEAPANLEVARFLGVENIFEASVVAAGDGVATVHIPLLDAHVRMDTSSAPAVGAVVTVAIRASRVLVAPPDDADNRLTGVVEHTTFLGEGVQYRIAVGGAHVLARSWSTDGRPATPGDAVAVSLPPTRISLFADQ
jgi:ABC-type Fe3+/spermidine/putrescine transport system ATPase subunit